MQGRTIIFIKTLLLLFLCSSFTNAQNLYLEVDNDLMLSSDDAYTGGIALTYIGDTFSENDTGVYHEYTSVMRSIFSTVLQDDIFSKKLNASIGIQHVTITPSQIQQKEPLYSEIPYTGILTTHFSLFAWDSDAFEQYRISVGVIGSNAYAREMQEWVHRVTGSEKAQGWNNQMGDIFTLGVAYLRGMRSYEREYEDGYSFEWFNSYYADVGNAFVGAGLGTLVRFGSNVPNNFDVPNVLFNHAANKVLNMHDRNQALGWSVELGTSINGTGYYYLYDEGKQQGYDVDIPRLILTSKVALNLYVENLNFSLELYPVVTRKNNIHSESWGRFSLGWHY
ncbi:MAG: lipid A deacylase LpxR family protein [Helicobacteraceae bacterium]|nr:lipid A deacylase LpxR family protein [Helicobacteraceae bacterium]